MPKLVAFYLPQFHPIPENDLWWGTGFTEWTNTRKATPLFKGHYQPRQPLNSNYYSLLDPATRAWQAQLASANGVYGFCYYHYWFGGRRLLERPFEEVLSTGSPVHPFCLSWANEPWTRTWTGRRWETLMPQTYGGTNDWTSHFHVLLRAFQDRRYIRVDDKPVFLIYRPSSIPRLPEMVETWKRLAKQNGLEGIELLGVLNTFEGEESPYLDGAVELEPMYTLFHGSPLPFRVGRYSRYALRRVANAVGRVPKAFLDLTDSNEVWRWILGRPQPSVGSKPRYYSAFVEWDNTPRRGPMASLILGTTPQSFRDNFGQQWKRASANTQAPLVFFNAWNEWAEGAYLEPDARFGDTYLRIAGEVTRGPGQNPGTRLVTP